MKVFTVVLIPSFPAKRSIMADLFSVIVNALSVADVCARLVSFLVKVRQGTKTVDDDLNKLIEEINSLSSVCLIIHGTFEKDFKAKEVISARPNPADSGEEAIGRLWHYTDTTLESCRTTLSHLDKLLADVLGDNGSKISSPWSSLRKYLRKQSRDDELVQLGQRLSKAHDCLQILLTALNLFVAPKCLIV